MHLLIHSTRNTAIGMLRKGVVYKLDDKDHRVRKVVANLTKGKPAAAKVLSEKELEAHLAAVESLVPKAEGKKAPEKIADLKKAAAKAEKDREDAEAAQAAAEQALDDAKSEISESAKALAEAQQRIAELEAAAQSKDAGKTGDGGK